jgi:hypothetical protein
MKIKRLLIFVSLMFITIFGITLPVYANTDCMLINLQSYTQPAIQEDKTMLYLTWETSLKIDYLAVNTYLPYDKQYEYSFSTDVMKPKDVIYKEELSSTDTYLYTLAYSISSDQLGTLRLNFIYTINEVHYDNIIYISTGDVEKNIQISTKNMIIASIVMIVFIIMGTTIIIENTRDHTLLTPVTDDEEQEDE